MPSPNSQTICPTCSAVVAHPDTRCDECGTFLQDQGEETNRSTNPDSDYELKKESSGFSGIFELADGASPDAEQNSSQKPPNAPSDSARSSNKKGSEAKSGSSGFSGIFSLADDAKSADNPGEGSSNGVDPGHQNRPSQKPPRPAESPSATTLPTSSTSGSTSPNAPSSGFSGVFRVAEEVRERVPNEEFSARPQSSARTTEPSPSAKTSSPSAGSLKKSDESMASVEIEDATPLPRNRESHPTKDDPQSDIIRLRCKKCGRKLRVKSTRAGQRIDCPKCENKIFVPSRRDLKADSDQSSARKRVVSDNELSFTALAKQLGSPAKSDPDTEATEGQQAALKRALSSRKYRKLTKVLEAEGLLPTEKLSQRADALRELGQSGDVRAYDWLVADLDHNELQIRQAAAVGLGDLGDPRSVPLLVSLLDDDSMVLRKAALLGLGKIKDPRSIKPLLLFGLNDPQMKFLASEAIIGMGQDAVQSLIELLDEQELGIVLEAIVLLGRIKDSRARRALMMVIDARQPLLQCHAIEALGQIGDPKSIGPLARLLKSPDANIRATAAGALSKMASNKNVVAPLVQALNDPDEDVVVQAATGLGETGVKRAAEPLSRLLHAPQENIRVAVAQAMGALGDQRAVPHLLALLDVDSQDLQLKVLSTLRTMKPPHISGELLKRLDHPNPVIRRRMIDVLAPIGDAEVAEQLERILRVDTADEVRMAAARALGEIADPASVDAIKEALHNDEFNVRCQAIGALGAIGDEECYNTLILLLEDQVSEVRFHAAAALGEVGDKKAIPALKSLLKDKNAMVVRGATKALEKLGETNVDSQVKRAQRSKQLEAIQGFVETLVSFLPDTPHAQKIVYGGTLGGLLLLLGLGWLIVKVFQGPPERVIVRGNVQTVSVAPNSSQLIVGRTMGLMEIYNLESGKFENKVPPPGGSRVVATSNPEVVAIVSATAVQLWKIGDPESPAPTSGHSKPISQFEITPDNALMATRSSDGVAIVWDLRTGEPRGKAVQLPKQSLRGFAVSPDGSAFAGGTDEGLVTIWNAASGEVLTQYQGSGNVSSSAYSPDGKLLAVSFANEMRIWNRESGEVVGTVPEGKALQKLRYDAQGKRLLGVEGNKLLLWDTDALQGASTAPKTIEVEKAEELTTATFSSDGTKIAVGGTEDASVWLFDAAGGQLLHKLNAR